MKSLKLPAVSGLGTRLLDNSWSHLDNYLPADVILMEAIFSTRNGMEIEFFITWLPGSLLLIVINSWLWFRHQSNRETSESKIAHIPYIYWTMAKAQSARDEGSDATAAAGPGWRAGQGSRDSGSQTLVKSDWVSLGKLKLSHVLISCAFSKLELANWYIWTSIVEQKDTVSAAFTN